MSILSDAVASSSGSAAAVSFDSVVSDLRLSSDPFAVATVIAVRGSASAKPGSKAVIDRNGRNVFGWVGGGCAESFVARNAVEAMGEGRTRIVVADLDDEVFGLGMPCGGVMDVFIEPFAPPERVSVVAPLEMHESLKHLGTGMGYELALTPNSSLSASSSPGLGSLSSSLGTGASMILALARGVASARGTSFASLRESKGVFGAGSIANQNWIAGSNEFLIMGSSRITEELARFGALARWPTRVYGWNLDPSLYPSSVVLQNAAAGYTDLSVSPGTMMIIASHHKGDHDFIQAALRSDANYVGLIASEKRSRLVFEHLSSVGLSDDQLRRIYAPAGLDLGCKNPSEIALSVVSEIILAREAARAH